MLHSRPIWFFKGRSFSKLCYRHYCFSASYSPKGIKKEDIFLFEFRSCLNLLYLLTFSFSLSSSCTEPVFLNVYGAQESNEFRLAGRYGNPIPTRFLAPIYCLKIPALYKQYSGCLTFLFLLYLLTVKD